MITFVVDDGQGRRGCVLYRTVVPRVQLELSGRSQVHADDCADVLKLALRQDSCSTVELRVRKP